MQIKDRIFYITGGAAGLGAEAARALHAKGALVLLIDRDEEGAAKLAASLGERARAAKKTDILNAEEIQAALDLGDQAWPQAQPAGVVHAAGIGMAGKTLDNDGKPYDFDVWKLVVDINLNGTFNVNRLVAARLVRDVPKPAQKAVNECRGLIINVASTAGLEGDMGQAAYGASKAGVIGLTLPMARDLSWWGVRAMTICPAMFDTQMGHSIPDRARTQILAKTGFPPRMGRPDEFASLVLALVENDMLNGTHIRIGMGKL